MKLPSESADWYVIQGKSGWEHLAAHELRMAGFEAYFPMRRIRNFIRRHRLFTNQHQPALRGYLFLATPRGSTVDWGRFRDDDRFRHVGRVLRASTGIPLRIDSKLVIAISIDEMNGRFDDTGAHDKLASRFAKGAEFTITDGPFATFQAMVECVTSTELIKVLVNLFGRETVLTLDPSQLDEVA